MSQGNYSYLEQQLENGRPLDPNVVANYWKRVFRQMRTPLIPLEQYDQFGQLDQIEDDVEKLKKIKELIDEMPKLNQRTLKFCIEFFQEVVDYESENRMTAYNIAITVSHNIFRSVGDTGNDIVNHGVYYDAFIRMIENYD